MRRRVRVLLYMLLSFLLGTGFAVQAQESTCIFTVNQAATVHIEYKYVTMDGEGIEKGSGFIISSAGHVITNAHVVSPRLKDVNAQSATISVRAGSLLNPPVEATLIVRDPSLDLALLKLPPQPGPLPWATVGISPINLPVGAPLIGLGFGASGDLAIVPGGQKTAHNTVVDGELKPWWQTNLGLNPGNSGGPIFGQLGTVVGIAVAKNDGAQLITYVIPMALAQHLINAADVRPAQAGRCAVFPECRNVIHGIERYEIDEPKSSWGDWRSGGYNRGAFCNDFLIKLRATYPSSTFEFVRDDEQNRKTPFPDLHAEYKYFCEYRRRENPIYQLRRSGACLQ